MDPFTERLLERTRARKEILAKKMNENSVSPVKRRAPLAENSQNVFEPKQDFMHKPASPKKTVQGQDMKPDTPAIRSVRSRLQHLAHARDVWDSADSGEVREDAPSPHRSCRTPEINLEALPPQPVTRKARFAALAADINNWVDDTAHPKNKSEEQPKKPTRKFFAEPKTDAQPTPAPRSTTPVKKSASPSPKKRAMTENSTSSPSKKQTSAQPSPKKRNIQGNSPCKKQSTAKNSPKKRTVAFAVTGHPNPAPRSGLHIATLRQVPHPERQVCNAVEKTEKNPVAEEPTVSRRAINQYKAIGKYTYEVSRDRPAKEAPKEAIKRQAPEPPKCTVKTSLKQGTPTKIQRMVAQISVQEKGLKSPENVSAHVGEMAKSIQTRLLEHQNSWQKNEINTKIQADRKKELQVIRKRWQKSSGNSTTGSPDTQEEVEETVQSEQITMTTTEPLTMKYKQEEVEPEEEEIEDEDDNMITEDDIEEETTVPHTPEQEKVNDDLEEENEEDEEEEEGSEVNDDDLNVSDVLGDIDDILNQEEQAMEEEEEARNALQEVESIKQKVQEQMLEQSDEDDEDSSVPATPPRKTKSLTYSVSTYRNQRKKALTLPPTGRTVVIKSPEMIREEQVEEEQPTTPKVKQLSVREKVKALNEEVSAQQSIIHQTSQALNLINTKPDYKGTMEEVEAERLLLIATQRRLACLSEIQHLKNQGGPHARKSSSEEECLAPCQGSVTVRDIRLPLKTEYILAITSGQDRPHHFFFVLVKHGAKVIASQLLSTRKALSGDCLPFSNMMAFNDLDGNFMLEVEVYQLNLKQIKYDVPEKAKGFFANITPKKLKTVRQGGRAQHMSSPGGPGAVQTSNFILVGSIRLTLNSINTERFMLSKVPFGAPIEGNIHLRMSCHSESRVIQRGFITMFDDISGFGSWHRRWLVLAGSKIAYWKYPDDEKRKEPINVIDLKKCVTREVSLLTRLVCARPNTFELMTRRRATNSDKSSLVASQQGSTVITKFWLSADSKDEREKWTYKLNKSLMDLRTWNRDAARPVDPPKPSETDI